VDVCKAEKFTALQAEELIKFAGSSGEKICKRNGG
jgi:hypothetical protein